MVIHIFVQILNKNSQIYCERTIISVNFVRVCLDKILQLTNYSVMKMSYGDIKSEQYRIISIEIVSNQEFTEVTEFNFRGTFFLSCCKNLKATTSPTFTEGKSVDLLCCNKGYFLVGFILTMYMCTISSTNQQEIIDQAKSYEACFDVKCYEIYKCT